MWGCGMGVTELPSNTQPGGPGFLSITTQQINDGVQGVSYSTVINTSGGSGRLTTCRVATGTLPVGFTFPAASGSTCLLTTNGQPVTSAPGRYTFTLEAGDSSTPQRTDQRVYSLTIRPEFTVNAPVVLDGVAARSYTRTFTVTTNLQNHTGAPVISSTEAGNGPITQCVISGLPAGFASGGGSASCAADATGVNVTVVMRALAGTLASGRYPFTISVTDSPIRSSGQAGVVAPASTTTIQPSLIVRQEFSLTQGTLAEGVQGRTYGVAPLAQGVTTNTVAVAPAVNAGQTAELGNGPLTSCSLSVAPADPALSVSVDPKDPARCLLTSASPVAAAGTYTVIVNASDSPILDPASSGAVVVPSNTRQEQLTWTVAPPISYSLNFDSAQGQPGQAPAAVENRTYGTTPKTPLLITATGGLSASSGLSMTVGGALPSGIVCVTPQPNPQPPGPTAVVTCSSGGSPVTASPGAASFTITASDPGNTATPPGSISSDALGHASHTLTVEAPLGLVANLADPLPHGVSGRPYGVAPAQPLTYTASGGLGGYSFTTPATIASPGAAFPQGIGCSQGAANAVNTFSCSAASITATGSSTVNYGPVPVTVDDTANATTPDGASSSTTFTLDRTLAVEPPLSITPVAGIDPPPAGVQGRTYGTGSGFAPLAYVISGGDPPYTNFVLPPSLPSPAAAVGGSTPEGGVPAPIACANTVVGTTTEVICSASAAVNAAAGAYPFSFSVSDSGSGETAATSIALPTRTITINAPLAWNGANPTSNAPPGAVQNRTYGGVGFTPLTYNATGGIGAYSFTLPPQAAAPGANNTPAGVACVASSGTQVVCTSGASAVSAAPGNYSFSIIVNDTADATTPGSQSSNTAATVTKPLVVEAPLAFSPTSQSLLPAVLGRAYGQGSGCTGGNCQPFNYVLSGGLGGYQSTITSSNGVTCALQADGKTYQCSSSGVSGAPSTPTLSFSATDTANTSTPSGAASGTQAAATATLPINAAMTITAPATLPPGVNGRAYGSGATCSGGACQSIVYSVSGGLGGYSTAPTLNGYPTGFACGPPANVVISPPSATYTCLSSTGVTGLPGSYSTGISASDTANASTPTATAMASPTTPLVIYPEITVTGPSSLAAAVQGRSYGVGATCSGGACQPIVYSVNGGLGGYSSPAPVLSGYPSGLTCGAPVNGTGSVPSATYTCSSSDVTGSPNSYTPGISVSDTANASTPAIATPKASNTATLTVDPALTLTAASPATWASIAVAGRSYGTGSTGCTVTPCAPIVYNASGGLGAYQPNPSVAASSLTSINLACSLVSAQYKCSSANLTTAPMINASTPTTLTVTASDVANASTPSGSSPNSTVALTVNPPLALVANPASFPDGVTERTYGVTGTNCGAAGASACTNLTFTASGGTGTYTFPAPSGFPTGFSCTASSTVYTCSANPVTAAAGSSSPSVTVNDSNSASVISGTQKFNGSLTVQPALTLTTTNVTPAALVNYSSYSSNALTATGGLTPYTWVAPGATFGGCNTAPTGTLPTGLVLGAATSIFTGTATSPSAADTDFSFGVCVTDTGNATTPPGGVYPPPNPATGTITLNVLSRYAFIVDTGTSADVRTINTGDDTNLPADHPIGPTGQTNLQGSVAITPNGLYAFVPLTASNGFAVFDTITGAALPKSPFHFPSGATCTGPVGVVFSTDSQNAFFACSGNNEVVEVGIGTIAGASGSVTAVAKSAATTGLNPAAITTDGTNLYVAASGSPGQLLIYSLTTGITTAPASFPLATGFTPIAIATATQSPDTYVYLAETKSGAAGQLDWFSVNGGTVTTHSPVAFAPVSATDPEPSCLAVTPDNNHLYVGLQGTDQVAVMPIPTLSPVTALTLPNLGTTGIGTFSPSGVVIPTLLPTLPTGGYRIFFTGVEGSQGEVVLLHDNSGAPTDDTTFRPTYGTTSILQGIASIPAPPTQ